MGWKASLIIIENPDNFRDEHAILDAIGKGNYTAKDKTTLEECIYPNDKSINIGFYNGNIVIGDDYQMTTNSLERAQDLSLTLEEKRLVELFPKSEIIIIACHSVVNYHGYSLIQNGQKIRLKTISAEEPVKECPKKMPFMPHQFKKMVSIIGNMRTSLMNYLEKTS